MKDVIKEYGADTVRLFMLFKAPPDMDIQWDARGLLCTFTCILDLTLLHVCVCVCVCVFVVSYLWCGTVATQSVDTVS